MGNRRSICVLILASACVVTSLDYLDIEALGVNCPNMVSCSAIGNSNFTRRNCECDRDCLIYDDCCIDARTRVSSRNNRRNTPYSCMAYGGEANLGAYVVHTCTRNFDGPAEIQRMCQNRDNISDPIMATPVTNTITQTTFRNRYCAECNNADETDLTSWSIKMDCDFTSTLKVSNSYIWENIRYQADLNKWGVTVGGSFQTCNLMFDMPQYLSSSIRYCRANVISSCARGWKRLRVKRDCESYMAVIYTNSHKVYRNPHCALCNNISVDHMLCDRGISARKKKPFSFALLLDVNQNDGDVVGVSRQVCAANQKYDPFFKKCRNLVCALPGYKIVNGKCKMSIFDHGEKKYSFKCLFLKIITRKRKAGFNYCPSISKFSLLISLDSRGCYSNKTCLFQMEIKLVMNGLDVFRHTLFFTDLNENGPNLVSTATDILAELKLTLRDTDSISAIN